MATQITASLPTLNFPKEVDYPTQEDWAAFSAAAELNFGILGGSWSTQMQLWKSQANAMSIESNNNADLAQGIANYQGDWTSKGYTLGQSVSVSGVYYICKLTHATAQNPTAGGSLYWNLAIGNWSLKVNNYGNETIAGVKTFSSNIVGNITGNSGTATKLSTTRTNYKDTTDSVVVGELMWKKYGNGHTIIDASNATAPNGTAIDAVNPNLPWTTGYPTLVGFNGSGTFGVRVDSARVADSATYAAAFTTAVGSAPSYACRAWVNFNGTGTVAIRASGNVSSITDNGVGDYAVNFTTAMPDINYNTVGTCGTEVLYSTNIFQSPYHITPNTTSATRCLTYVAGASFLDMSNVSVSVFR